MPKPDGTPSETTQEPVWLVRAVIVLFLVGFAAFFARQVYDFVLWLR